MKEPTLEDVRVWRAGFSEGSWARAALDMLLRELSIAQASRELVDTQAKRIAEAWHALQVQPAEDQIVAAFYALDEKLCTEGTLDDPEPPDNEADRLSRGAFVVREFLAAPGPFHVDGAEVAAIDRAIAADDNRPKCDDPKCGCHD